MLVAACDNSATLASDILTLLLILVYLHILDYVTALLVQAMNVVIDALASAPRLRYQVSVQSLRDTSNGIGHRIRWIQPRPVR